LLEKFKPSCVHTNQTRALPKHTKFVFIDLETRDSHGNKVVPSLAELESLFRYCRQILRLQFLLFSICLQILQQRLQKD